MKKTLVAACAAAIAASMSTSVSIAEPAPSMEEMWRVIKSQQAEIERLKKQQSQTLEKVELTDVKVEATAAAVEQGGANASKVLQWAEKTSIGGYGEHHFNHFKDKDDQVDAHRFVVYVGHQFSDTVRFFSEIELEHGLVVDTADGSGPGEVELEQAFIEWDFAKKHSLTMGQFLLPVGILNETHEPDTFYGVERNNVEKNIIPTTWWETGVMVSGEILPGLSYNSAIHSGLSAPITGSSAYKIRNGRQKSAKANAEDLAWTGRLTYTGVPGLELSATWQEQQDITQGALSMDDASATLRSFHARYQTGPFTFTALRAQFDVDANAAKLLGRDEQEGWYAELSWMLTRQLGIFMRQSEWDNNAGNNTDTEIEQFDIGLNYWLTPTVVLKADYSEVSDDENTTSAGSDSVNLGLGWSF